MKRLILPAASLMVLLSGALLVSHARAEQSPDACFDQLLLRWNAFASDSNRHIQTVEAKPADREKAHSRLDREYEAVKALACW